MLVIVVHLNEMILHCDSYCHTSDSFQFMRSTEAGMRFFYDYWEEEKLPIFHMAFYDCA